MSSTVDKALSLLKLVVVWFLLIGFPSLLLGSAPLLASVWVNTVFEKAFAAFAGIWSLLALLLLVALGWLGGRRQYINRGDLSRLGSNVAFYSSPSAADFRL